MADVRCPKCGKPNPADAEVCRHCWQRLKPANGDAPGAQPPASNEPDWLRELRSDRGADSASQPDDTSPAGDQEVPDWLSQIRARNEPESTGLDDLFGKPTSPAESTPDWLQDAQPAASAADSGGDWLSGLRAGETEQPSSDDTQPAGEDAWLSNLQNLQAAPESDEAEEALPASSEGAPDLSAWLGSLDASDDVTQRAQPAAQEAPDFQSWSQNLDAGETTPPADRESITGITDWLKQADGTQSEQPAAPQPEAEPPAGQSFGITGWLNSLDTPEAPAEPTETPAAPDAGETPSWMAGLDETTPAPEEVQPSGKVELPDWLMEDTSDLPVAEQPPSEQPPAPPRPVRAPTEELPSWMAGFTREEPPAEQPTVPAEEVPSWMDQGATEASAPEQPAENIPAWLGEFGTTEEEQTTPAEVAPTQSVPSWLGEFSTTEEEPPAQAAPAEGVPSWLGEFGATEEEPPAQAAPAQGVPSWLGEFEATEEEQPAPAEAAPAEGVPDWLGAFGAATAAVAAAGEEEESIPEAAEAAPLGDDWLQSFGQMTDQPAEAAETAEPVGDLGIPGWQTNRDATKETPSTPHPFIEEGLPAWMNSIEQPIIAEESSTAPALYEEPDSSPLTPEQGTPFQVDLPDWIGEEPAPMAASDSLEGEEEPQLELAHAELPSWVEDMRPVESAIGGELISDGDQRVEKAGPLAGLRGILPGEETAVRYRKLPVYSVKLRVSERQRQYINLLDNVISLENQPQVLPALPSKAPQFILRLAIGILLIVGLLLPPLFDVQISSLPSVAPEGMLELYNMVEGLPDGAPVLLAVEYEPALSGEMKLASSAVIEHLMVKNAVLAVVSTSPTGPIMAEQLLDDIHLRQPGYDLDNQMVNLSYLAGGTSSLLEFANRPRSAAPVALDTSVTGQLPWQRPALQGIYNLQDFALVIMLTDSAETGRAWVEQVQPMLGSTPLTMVTSAQAAPLLQPYLKSQQVDGLVSGLYGGAMYEKRSGRVSLPAGYYMGYQGAFLVGILVLFLGGIISMVMSMNRRAKKGKA
ncbi:MAG: hypothetical protein JW987_07965 [Anaerolineaceae bacterium]|nr:hypothetical protein [Anaerolineaceae bacterium]